MESLIQIILRKTGPESFSGQLSVDRADVIARKKGDGKASHREGNFRKCSQLCPNLFADRKMEGAARRASGEGEWKLSTYPKSIDWNSFFKTFPSPKSYVKHVPQSLLVSVRPSALPFTANIVIDFQFQSRAIRNCVSEFYGCSSKLPGSGKRQGRADGVPRLQTKSLLLGSVSKKKTRHSCTNIKCRCERNAQCSGKPHINTNPSDTSRTTLISRLSSHVFSIVFSISIYRRFDKTFFAAAAFCRSCENEHVRPSGFVCRPTEASVLTHQTIIESSHDDSRGSLYQCLLFFCMNWIGDFFVPWHSCGVVRSDGQQTNISSRGRK